MKVFYREAGPADAPVVLLLHGFPTSSHMFRNLIPLLADRYPGQAFDVARNLGARGRLDRRFQRFGKLRRGLETALRRRF